MLSLAQKLLMVLSSPRLGGGVGVEVAGWGSAHGQGHGGGGDRTGQRAECEAAAARMPGWPERQIGWPHLCLSNSSTKGATTSMMVNKGVAKMKVVK